MQNIFNLVDEILLGVRLIPHRHRRQMRGSHLVVHVPRAAVAYSSGAVASEVLVMKTDVLLFYAHLLRAYVILLASYEVAPQVPASASSFPLRAVTWCVGVTSLH